MYPISTLKIKCSEAKHSFQVEQQNIQRMIINIYGLKQVNPFLFYWKYMH